MAERLSRERIAEIRSHITIAERDHDPAGGVPSVDLLYWTQQEEWDQPTVMAVDELSALLDAYEAPRWTHDEDICREHRLALARIADRHSEARDRLLALVREVARSGVELDDPRLGYVTVQIDRETWEAIRGRDDG